MALPTLEKSWQFNVNQNLVSTGTVATDNANILYAIKNSLVTFADAPWTVVLSSDGATSGASDKWTDASKVIHSGANYSWIVLKQTGILSNYQLLLTCSSSTSSIAIKQSPAVGFSGGSTTTDPTAADSVTLLAVGTWMLSTAATVKLHVLQTTTGSQTWVLACSAGVLKAAGGFGAISNPVTGMTHPAWGYWKVNTPLTMQYFADTTNANVFGRDNATNMTMYMTVEGSRNNNIPDELAGINQVSNQYPILGMGIYSKTATKLGRHGRIADAWFGTTGIPDGSTYPNDSTRQFVQFNNVILPWNGTIPQVT